MSFLIKDGKVLMADGKPISAEVSGDSLSLLAEAVENTNKIINESYVGGNATYHDLLEGKTAYAKGKKIEGTIKVYNGETSAELRSTSDTKTFYTKGKYLEENITVSTPTKETETEDNPVYTYFKNIFDNTNIEGYSLKLMCVYSGEHPRKSANSGSFLLSINYPFYGNSNVILNVNNHTTQLTSSTKPSALTGSTFDEVYPFKVYDSMINREMEFGFVMVHFKEWSDISGILSTRYASSIFPMFATGAIYYFVSDEVAFRSQINLSNTEPFCQTFRRITNIEGDDIHYPLLNLAKKNEQAVIPFKRVVQKNNTIFNLYKCKSVFIDLQTTYANTNGISFDNDILEKLESSKRIPLWLQGTEYPALKEVINFYQGGNTNSCIFSGSSYVPEYLEELRLYDITNNLCIGYTYRSKNLSYESIIHTISQLIPQTSKRTLTMGTYNLAKISDVYVKELEITQEMYEEDNKVYDKRPFYVCDSTEEGAMSITDYVALKNWSLA